MKHHDSAAEREAGTEGGTEAGTEGGTEGGRVRSLILHQKEWWVAFFPTFLSSLPPSTTSGVG